MTPSEMFGLIILICFLIKVIYNCCHFFIFSTKIGKMLGFVEYDLRKCGPWAVITGSTDGIGKVYAKKLAAVGLNVVLISRNPEKLSKVAKEIHELNSNVEVKAIAVDFTEGQSIYPKIKSELTNMDVGILINNVGMVYGEGQPFIDIDDDKPWHDMINCNCMSMVRMCHLVLPQMIRRRQGVIVNIGSVSSTFSTPYLTLYGATKAFVDKFSTDLGIELKSRDIIIQTLHPGYVVTNMSQLRRPTLRGPTAETYVNAAINSLGIENRTAGYWYHKILMYWAEMGSFLFPELIGQHSMKFLKRYRENTLSKSKIA